MIETVKQAGLYVRMIEVTPEGAIKISVSEDGQPQDGGKQKQGSEWD